MHLVVDPRILVDGSVGAVALRLDAGVHSPGTEDVRFSSSFVCHYEIVSDFSLVVSVEHVLFVVDVDVRCHLTHIVRYVRGALRIDTLLSYIDEIECNEVTV